MALDWLPILPDLPRLAPRPPWRQWTTWRFPIIVPDLLLNETFAPSFPDRAPSQRIVLQPAERSTVSAALFARVISPLDWHQQRPDRGSDQPMRLSTALRPAGDPPSSGAALLVAQQLAWRPQLPDQWPPRRLVVATEHAPRYFVQPLVTIPTGGCALWGPEAFTPTDLLQQAYTATDLVSEAFTHTDLIAEGLC